MDIIRPLSLFTLNHSSLNNIKYYNSVMEIKSIKLKKIYINDFRSNNDSRILNVDINDPIHSQR